MSLEDCRIISLPKIADAKWNTRDPQNNVVAFSAESKFIERDELPGLPVVSFERLGLSYSPKEHGVYVAVTYTQLNRRRTRLYKATKGRCE